MDPKSCQISCLPPDRSAAGTRNPNDGLDRALAKRITVTIMLLTAHRVHEKGRKRNTNDNEKEVLSTRECFGTPPLYDNP